MVIIFCGIPGSGKSTLAKILKKKLKKVGKVALFVSDEVSDQIYKKISDFLKEKLNKVDYIIVDATFYKKKWREMVFKICNRKEVITLDIHCPLKVCLQKNKKRKKPLPEKVLHIINHEMERPKRPDLVIDTNKTRLKEAASLVLNKIILEKFGTLYSKELGIDLDSKKPSEIFKWFLASLLFGARISETIAKRTYRVFKKYNLLTPKKILKAGINFLINPIMREGGYVRYDGKTSNEILRVSKTLIEKYDGDLNKLEREAKNSRDLEKKLQEFYSVGPITCRIFLRELRGIWEKAESEVGRFVKLAAKGLKFPASLNGLKDYWKKHKVRGYDFRHFEVALLRWVKAKS